MSFDKVWFGWRFFIAFFGPPSTPLVASWGSLDISLKTPDIQYSRLSHPLINEFNPYTPIDAAIEFVVRQSTDFSSFTGSGSDTVFSGLLSQTPGQREEPGCGGPQTQGLTHMSRPALMLHCWSLHFTKEREMSVSVWPTAAARNMSLLFSECCSVCTKFGYFELNSHLKNPASDIKVSIYAIVQKFGVDKGCIYLIKNKFSKKFWNIIAI